MPLGNTPQLQIPLMAENDNQKYLAFNDAIQALDDSVNRLFELDFTASNLTLLESQLTRYQYFRGTGNTVARTLTIPPTVGGIPAVTTNRLFVFDNRGTAAITLTHGVGGVTIDVLSNTIVLVYCDGTDINSVSSGSGTGGGGTGFTMAVQDENDPAFVTNPTFMKFVGNSVAATLNGLGAEVVFTLSETQDDGVSQQTDTSFFNFTGSGVTVTPNGLGVDVDVPGGGSGIEVREEGIVALSSPTLNFIGQNVTAVNNGGVADVSIVSASIQDESVLVSGDPTFINFTGSNVTVTPNGVGVDVDVSGGGSGVEVREEGTVALTSPTLNFIGQNVTAVNNGGVADVSIVSTSIQDESLLISGDPTFINFIGTGVVVTPNGTGVDVTFSGGGGGTVDEAPLDGKPYLRLNGQWVEYTGTDFDFTAPSVGFTAATNPQASLIFN